jgi:hypothetical protein
MEAAPSDQSSGDGVTWCGYDYRSTTTGVTATAVGTGESNTQSLVFIENADTGENNAARLCYDFSLTNESGNQYTDWFLPGKDELYAMYSNLYLHGSGGFTLGDEYWSSSEVDSVYVYTQKFNSGGYQNNSTKYSSLALKKVRAVRMF